MKVFLFQEYRAFLQHQIHEHRQIRGYQGVLATEAGCQRSFLSQVLNSHVELTPDHGANLCRFWKFDEDETEYFLALLGRSRAATPVLRNYLDRKLKSLRKKKDDLTERFERPNSVVNEDAATYYSSWQWAAIHMACSVPDLQTPQSIAGRLNLDLAAVQFMLSELTRMTLVERVGNKFKATKNNLHLAENSPFNRNNHLNWRWKSLEAGARLGDETHLHYSAVFAASKRDLPLIRELLAEMLEKSRHLIGASPEEDLAVMCCDFSPL